MENQRQNDVTMPAVNDMKEVRSEFVRVVAKSVDDLIRRHGFSRDRATSLVLREIATTSSAPSEEELSRVKQRYMLSHHQASRAVAVSTALKRIVQSESVSFPDAVHCLTQRLENASFLSNTDFSYMEGTESATSLAQRKPSEISVPQITKHHSPKSPTTKRARSTTCLVKCNSKPLNKPPSRKRSIDDAGTLLAAEQPAEPRPRSDSVIEAVSVKMHHQEPNSDKPPSRNKRNRSTMDDSDATVKRQRPATG